MPRPPSSGPCLPGYLRAAMDSEKLPASERKFLRSMERRLGDWRHRDFMAELVSAVRGYGATVSALEKSRPVSPASIARAMSRLASAEMGYRRAFGDFCELVSVLRPTRLTSMEDSFLHAAAAKDEIDRSSPALAVFLSAAASTPGLSRSVSISAAACLRRMGPRPPSGSPAHSSALAGLDSLEHSYARSLERERKFVLFGSRRALAGLPPRSLSAARRSASSMGKTGWALPLDETLSQESAPLLEVDSSRRRLMSASRARGSRVRSAALALSRARRSAAKMFSRPSWSHFRMEWSCASARPASAWKMLRRLAAALRAPAARDLDLARAHGWDGSPRSPECASAYIPPSEVDKPSFDPVRVLEGGCFHAARSLFGISFERVRGIRLYSRGVRLYRAADSDGRCMGYLSADLFRSPGKVAGAWTSCWEESRSQEGYPFVGIFCNLEPGGCSFSGVEDVFHEFGHAIHALISGRVPVYRSALGMPSDMVEVPSLLAETWALEPSVYSRVRGPLSPSLEEVRASLRRPGTALSCMGDILSSAADLVWHGPRPVRSPSAVRRLAMKKLGIPSSLPFAPTYSEELFAHVFCSDYDAGYFSYLWCESAAVTISRWLAPSGKFIAARGRRLAGVLARGEMCPSEDFVSALGIRDGSSPSHRLLPQGGKPFVGLAA